MNIRFNKKLRVAIIEDALPYSTCTPKKEGIAVEIWKNVAHDFKLDYEYICYGRNYDKALIDLNDDKIDVLLAEISVITRRFDLALYSRPYYISELYVYRKARPKLFLSALSNTQLLKVFYIILAIVLIYTFLIMYVLKLNLIEAFYKTALSFLSIGGEIIPTKSLKFRSNYYRLINTIWSIFLFLFRAFTISQIIASLVSQKGIIDKNELDQIRSVHVLKNSSYVDNIKRVNKQPIEIDSSEQIAKIISESNYDKYWLEDADVLNNSIRKANKIIDLEKTEKPLFNDEFTIAVNKRLPLLLNMINKTIVKLQDDGSMLRICKGYLESEADRCVL